MYTSPQYIRADLIVELKILTRCRFLSLCLSLSLSVSLSVRLRPLHPPSLPHSLTLLKYLFTLYFVFYSFIFGWHRHPTLLPCPPLVTRKGLVVVPYYYPAAGQVWSCRSLILSVNLSGQITMSAFSRSTCSVVDTSVMK